MKKSRLVNGRIIPPTHLELNVVDHCNITCRSCNHASPTTPAWFADPDTVHRDFSILSKYYRPAFIKVLGGEPLMHKHLDAVIQAARATGISGHFTLTTNGTLLHKASDAVWEAVDELEISVYPGVAGVEANIRLAQEKARDFGKKLSLFYYDQFRATFSLKGTANRDLVGRIYAACKIANLWGCHTVREGYFYKCPQSIYAAMLTDQSAASDRIAIVDDEAFQPALLEYVNSPTPLAACTYCVGTAGVQEPHELLPRAQWRTHIDISSEQAVDHDWLESSLLAQDGRDDCKIPARFKPPRVLAGTPRLQRWLRAILPASMDFGALRLGQRMVRQRAGEARNPLELTDRTASKKTHGNE